MSQAIEYELTFLAKYLPEEVKKLSPTVMVDTYFPNDPQAHPQLRLRRNGDRYEITKKSPVNDRDLSVQVEHTIALNEDEYSCLLAADGKTVEKSRYKVTIGGYDAEVDIFGGKLSGLVLIDFEFTDLKIKDSFTPPDCCLADVTQENFIAGGLLAGKTYSDIEVNLQRFSYQPIK